MTPNTTPGGYSSILPPAATPGIPVENQTLPQTLEDRNRSGSHPREIAVDGGFRTEAHNRDAPPARHQTDQHHRTQDAATKTVFPTAPDLKATAIPRYEEKRAASRRRRPNRLAASARQASPPRTQVRAQNCQAWLRSAKRYARRFALLAQLVEHLHGKEGVDGSSPSEGSTKSPLTVTSHQDPVADRAV